MQENLDADRGPLINAVCSAMIVLCSAAVVLRFISRKLSNAGYWWDDWTIIPALPCIFTQDAMLYYGTVSLGYGQHIEKVDDVPQTARRFLRALFIDLHMYNTAVVFIKVSVILFYARIFAVSKGFRKILCFLMIWVICWYIGLTFALIGLCTPMSHFWDTTAPGKCGSKMVYEIFQSISNISSDIIVLLVPLPMIWRLQVQRPQKVALFVIFLLGYFVVFMATIRLVFFVKLGRTSQEDFTWVWVEPGIWGTIEPSLAVVFACIPSFAHLYALTVKFVSPVLMAIGDGSADCFRGSKGRLDTVGFPSHPASEGKPSGGSDSFTKLRDIHVDKRLSSDNRTGRPVPLPTLKGSSLPGHLETELPLQHMHSLDVRVATHRAWYDELTE